MLEPNLRCGRSFLFLHTRRRLSSDIADPFGDCRFKSSSDASNFLQVDRWGRDICAMETKCVCSSPIVAYEGMPLISSLGFPSITSENEVSYPSMICEWSWGRGDGGGCRRMGSVSLPPMQGVISDIMKHSIDGLLPLCDPSVNRLIPTNVLCHDVGTSARSSKGASRFGTLTTFGYLSLGIMTSTLSCGPIS